jgi:hypothetical protein
VAVDKTPVRPAGEGLDSEQVASLRPHGQSAAAMSGFAATATNAEMLRLTGLTLLLLALAIMAWPLANRRRSDELLH